MQTPVLQLVWPLASSCSTPCRPLRTAADGSQMFWPVRGPPPQAQPERPLAARSVQLNFGNAPNWTALQAGLEHHRNFEHSSHIIPRAMILALWLYGDRDGIGGRQAGARERTVLEEGPLREEARVLRRGDVAVAVVGLDADAHARSALQPVPFMKRWVRCGLSC